jgi:hypothetical protein
MAWRRVVESVELEGGLCPWWYVHLLPKMVNKINAIEYSGGTTSGESLVSGQFGAYPRAVFWSSIMLK